MNRSSKKFNSSAEIVYRINSSSRVKGLSCTTDRDGNVYVLGQFFDNMFSDNILLTTDESGIFIAQIDKDGRWRWATAIHTHTSSNDIRMSCEITYHKKNLYSAFVIDNVTTGARLGFVVRTDRGGNIIYKTRFTGQLEPTIRISLDNHDNAYIVNSYTGVLKLSDTVALPEVAIVSGTTLLTGEETTATTSTGTSVPITTPGRVVRALPAKGYVAKLNVKGDWLWARDISDGPINSSNLNAIATKPNGKSYVTGWFTGTASLDKIKIKGSERTRNFIIAEIGSRGNWIEADSFSDGMGTGIAIDKRDKNIYVTGGFRNKLCLGGSRIRECGGNIFVAKLDKCFKSKWITTTKYDTDIFNVKINIVVDKDNNSYIDGPLLTCITFGKFKLVPTNMTSENQVDIFLAKLSPNGSWVWANKIVGSESTSSKDLTVNKWNQLYVTGGFGRKLIIDCLKEFGPTTSLFLVKMEKFC